MSEEIKLGMTIVEVQSILGAPGEPGMGGEGEISWSWWHEGNYVGVQFGMED